VHELPLSEVKEGERFRKEYGDLKSLCDSIAKHGVIQPIIITRDKELVAGGRRLRASFLVGKETVPFVYRDECDELTLRELELEENLHRKNLTWVEEASLTAEIDRLKREKYGSVEVRERTDLAPEGEQKWGTQDTAKALGVDRSTVSRNLAVARALEVMPELAEVSDRATALRLIDEHIEALEREISVRESKEKGTFQEVLYYGDALEFLAGLEDESIDLLLTDPPYGSDIQTGGNRMNIHFDDSHDNSLELLTSVLKEAKRVLKPNAHVYIFCSADVSLLWKMCEICRVVLGRDPTTPLVWVKNGSFGLVDFSQSYAPDYKFIIFCPAPGRSLTEKRNNTLLYPAVLPTKRITPVEKPVPLIAELIRMSTVPGEVVIDPFVGSGAVLEAAIGMGRVALGSEKDYEMYKAASLRLQTVKELPKEEDEEAV